MITFPSKVDGGIRLVGIAAPLVTLGAVVLMPAHAPPLIWLPVALTAVTALLVGWILISTAYDLDAHTLVARSGPFSWRIPLAEITAVRPSTSTRSGPALSLDRLEVVHSGGRVLLISPADRTGFLALLHRRAPHLAP